MKIAIVSQYFDPEPVPIPGILARALVARGHQVTVVTGEPSYPDGRDRYRGYSAEEKGGAEVVRRVWSSIPRSRGAVGRLASYVSFGLSSLAAGRPDRDTDVVYVYATQMTAAIGPAWWRRFRGIPYVLHVQDLWPESITGSGLVAPGSASRVIAACLGPWLRTVYRRASATIAISPGMRELLVERGADSASTHSVLNWAADESSVEWEPSSPGTLRLMYGGNLGEMQDLVSAIEACALLADLPGFSFTIVGSGAAEPRLRAMVAERGIANVAFVGRVSQDNMRALYATSDFQLVSLIDMPIFRVTIPSKLQASLAAGIPVISTVEGDAANIVEGEGVGISAPAGDHHRLADAFRRAYRMSSAERRAMGERARKYYFTAMSQQNGVDQIEQILVSASRQPRSGRK